MGDFKLFRTSSGQSQIEVNDLVVHLLAVTAALPAISLARC